MSEKKFTDGPWKLKCASSVEIGKDWWYANNQMISAAEISKRAVTREANAHLIAAAPELLEALEILYGEAVGDCISGERMDKARDAIAKAYGETP